MSELSGKGVPSRRSPGAVAVSAVLHVAIVGTALYASGIATSTPRTVAVNRSTTYLVFAPLVPVMLDVPTPRLHTPRSVVTERPAPEPPKERVEIVSPPAREMARSRAEPAPTPARHEPVLRSMPVTPLPKPAVTVGAFQPNTAPVRTAAAASQVSPTGFEPPTAQAPAITLGGPKVGAFDVASGSAGPRPGTDRPSSGVVTAGFGTPAASPAPAASRASSGVSEAGFGSGSTQGRARASDPPSTAIHESGFDARPAPQKALLSSPSPQRIDLPVEVLFKPAPQYTDEARTLKLEGDVLLEVEFTASSQVRVLRIVRGLGHGLDEAAVRAAEQMRFKPARAAGLMVDFRTTVHIVFRLT